MATIPANPIDGSAQALGQRHSPLVPQVAAAVRALNESGYLGEGREVLYSVDPSSRLPVVRVVDTSTEEIITQWPEPYVLELAAQAKAQETGEDTRDNEAIGD